MKYCIALLLSKARNQSYYTSGMLPLTQDLPPLTQMGGNVRRFLQLGRTKPSNNVWQGTGLSGTHYTRMLRRDIVLSIRKVSPQEYHH